ncbi:MAG: NAD(P)-dependent alcohol dehydrogenase [Verrucomicrobiia bacterium]
MSTTTRAFAAFNPREPLKDHEMDLGPLRDGQVEIEVESWGVCHSDLSMLDNEWGFSAYPLVAGHEIVGTVTAAGPDVKRVSVGDRVGLGWFSESCMACPDCLSGDHNLCATSEQTIVGRSGGFAERVRCHWTWATPLPPALDVAKAGPLFCGGITVFSPFLDFGVRPTDRVGIVGVGGLGHLAVQFADKWGCEVFAFSSDESKHDELRRLGADHVVNSRDPASWKGLARSLDLLLVTVNVSLDWPALIETLRPDGRLHFVGAVLEPVSVSAFSLITTRRSVSGSPLGSPHATALMLEFCARHGITPVTEHFPMSHVNDALEHLRAGKARYRIVLDADWE